MNSSNEEESVRNAVLLVYKVDRNLSAFWYCWGALIKILQICLGSLQKFWQRLKAHPFRLIGWVCHESYIMSISLCEIISHLGLGLGRILEQ